MQKPLSLMPFTGFVSLPVMELAGLEEAATNMATMSSFEEVPKSKMKPRFSSVELVKLFHGP